MMLRLFVDCLDDAETILRAGRSTQRLDNRWRACRRHEPVTLARSLEQQTGLALGLSG